MRTRYRFAWAWFIAAVIAAPSFAITATEYDGTAKTAAGVAINAATCTVFVSATSATKATIYSDSIGSSQANPFTTASNGTYAIFLVSGRYRIDCSNGTTAFSNFVTMPLQTTGGGGGGLGTVTSVSTASGITGGPITDTGTIALDYTATLAGNPAMLASHCQFATTGIVCEGATADTNETLLTFADPGSDTTVTIPATTGTLALTSGNVATATALAADPSDCSAGQVATGIAASGALSCTATPAVTSVTGILLGGGADDADSGLVRGSNNVALVCSEKATTGTDSCLTYTSSDTWTTAIAGTTRLTVAAGSLNFTSSSNTNQEFTLDATSFGPASQGSNAGWTFYAGGSAKDALTSSGYMLNTGSVLGFDSGNPGSTTTKPQGQLKGGQSKTLTDNSATAFARLTMSSGSTIGGRVTYLVGATDATDFQSRAGITVFAAVNKAGTITCTISSPLLTSELEVVAASTGTLVNNGFTCADAGSNLLELRANFDSSLTGVTDTMKWQMEAIGVQGTLVITPQ